MSLFHGLGRTVRLLGELKKAGRILVSGSTALRHAPRTLTSLGFLREAYEFKASPGLHGETLCQPMYPTVSLEKNMLLV